MIGAIIGDIAGSRFEFKNYKGKDFKLLTREDRHTDDTVMTLAVARSLLDSNDDESLYDITIENMQIFGRRNLQAGYGSNFKKWILSDNPQPYNSWGNGAAMRISPVGWAAKDLNEVRRIAKVVTETTHNHPEGIKAAEAVSSAIFLARNGATMEQLKRYLETYYDLNFTLDEIRPSYKFHVSCQRSVPQAIVAFLESKDFEDAIRNAISIGGDSDTIGAITGGIAEAYYGVPSWMRNKLKNYINGQFLELIDEFEKKYGSKIEGEVK